MLEKVRPRRGRISPYFTEFYNYLTTSWSENLHPILKKQTLLHFYYFMSKQVTYNIYPRLYSVISHTHLNPTPGKAELKVLKTIESCISTVSIQL